ncbi:hypothetical protein C8R44DRAFT_532394, partial [Mycena epipterygia]
VLERYEMADCNPKATPLPAGIVLSLSQNPITFPDITFIADKPYCEAVGSIQHAANTT